MLSSENTVLLPHPLLVLQLVRWEGGGRRALKSAFPRNPSKDAGNCFEFETLQKEAQPLVSGEQPNENRGQPPQLPLRRPLHRAQGSPGLPQAQGPRPTSQGRQEGASECPLASKDEGVLTLAYPLPRQAYRLQSLKMFSTTQLVAINHSQPRFPQTHRLSLSAR